MEPADPRDVAGAERRIRDAGLAAVDDVGPRPLRDRVGSEVGFESTAPGVVALAASGGGTAGVTRPAAGVQLIYDGLRLTREVAAADPWNGGAPEDGDLAVLAADVLVARGFYLVANAPAADRAVDVVRQFGRDQSIGRSQAGGLGDLERSILPLALAVGRSMTDDSYADAELEAAVRRTADRLSQDAGPGFPPTATVIDATAGAVPRLVDPTAFRVSTTSRPSITE